MENAYVYVEGGMHDKPHGRKVSIFSLRSFKWGVLDHAFWFLNFRKLIVVLFFYLGIIRPVAHRNSELKNSTTNILVSLPRKGVSRMSEDQSP